MPTKSNKSQEGASAPNQEQPAIPLMVNLQYIKDLSFEVPHGHSVFTTLTQPPQVSINVDVQGTRIEADKNHYEVALSVKAEAIESDAKDPKKARVVFVAELCYAAVVTLEGIPDEVIEPMLLVETPRLLFPFVRSILCDVTRDGGFPPIILQPIDFVALWQSKKAQEAASTGQVGQA